MAGRLTRSRLSLLAALGVGAMSGILIHPMSGVYMAGADPRRQYATLAW